MEVLVSQKTSKKTSKIEENVSNEYNENEEFTFEFSQAGTPQQKQLQLSGEDEHLI
jgi:hypothetical protein